MTDYYSLLGIESDATKAEIKKNYRLLATKFHPDKSNDSNAEKFIAITEAYDVLSNKKSRAKYDLLRWEKLKQQEASDDSWTVVTPPLESTRTKRNKSQQKRSIKYHQTNSGTEKSLQLIIESFYIVSRYVLHILGTTLLLFILSSLISNLADAFEKNIIRGIFLSAIVCLIVYSIFWILKNVYLEFNKDLEAFSVFYKVTQKKIAPIAVSVFSFVLLLYIVLLKVYF